MRKISYHPSFGEYAFDISPEERAAVKRYSMGFFQGAPAMFEHLDGKYVKWEDVQPTLTERLQQRCSDWGAYWRAPDGHGVELTHEQALELLRDALGVEVEFRTPTRGATGNG